MYSLRANVGGLWTPLGRAPAARAAPGPSCGGPAFAGPHDARLPCTPESPAKLLGPMGPAGLVLGHSHQCGVLATESWAPGQVRHWCCDPRRDFSLRREHVPRPAADLLRVQRVRAHTEQSSTSWKPSKLPARPAGLTTPSFPLRCLHQASPGPAPEAPPTPAPDRLCGQHFGDRSSQLGSPDWRTRPSCLSVCPSV